MFLLIILIECFLGISLAFASSVTVSWDQVVNDTTGAPETGAIYYQVYGQTFPAFPVADENFLGATATTEFTHTDARIVDADSDFFFRVIATDEWGNSSETSNVKGTSAFVLAQVKVFLEGAYDADGDTMRTTLLQNDLLPLTSPYDTAPRTILEMPANIVDWIYVGLRTEAAGPTITQASFLLKNDGTIVEEDGGTAEIGLPDVGSGDYYIIVNHRNHLAMISSNEVLLENVSTTLYNFTNPLENIYGEGGAKELELNIWGCIAGDGNMDGGIYAEDYTIYRTNQGNEGYLIADYNMDGGVYAEDYTLRKVNQGLESTVP